MPQLSFDWPVSQSYAAEDFIVSASNEAAAGFVEHWPHGNTFAAVLSGPPSCGKTHLAARWRVRMRAGRLDGASLGRASSAAIWGDAPAQVLEDIHAITDEKALFHLLRHVETHPLPLLMTSQTPVKHLPFRLPDLCSRLQALPQALISAPDDTLLSGYLLKCFADRQWRVEPGVITYLTARIERSFGAAKQCVEKMDRRMAESKRDFTIPVVRSLMEQT